MSSVPPPAIPSSVRPRAAGANGHAEAAVRVGVVPRVAVVVVTWNRRGEVDRVLRSIAAQRYDLDRVDVVVVDNASTDATSEHLARAWRAEALVENPTEHAHEPAFDAAASARVRDGAAPSANAGGFASLTIVRNSVNHGGCGGFNTGLAFVERVLDDPARPARPEYAWLVDDDADLPEDALARLTRTAQADPTVGIVGSRTVDLADRATTIETTIYYDAARGRMGDTPPRGHRLEAAHAAWVAQVGGTKGVRAFAGVREVDVVSACSLLARWSCVREVGLWDHRFFIYCDDADWCLRFGRAGYRVVVDLDAVVFHTPWFQKLTPARVYYSQRNAVWVARKQANAWKRRLAVARWLISILYDCLLASFHRRLFHAEIIRRTAEDAVRGRGGRLANDGPSREGVEPALDAIGALAPGASVAVLCADAEAMASADALRARVASWLLARDRAGDQPRWIHVVSSDVFDADFEVSPPERPRPERLRFTRRLRSKLRRQWGFLRRPPNAVVVFDQHADFPLLFGGHTVHVDRKWPDRAQVERDSIVARARFLARWAWTGVLCVGAIALNRRFVSRSRYG